MDYGEEEVRKEIQDQYWKHKKSVPQISAEMGIPRSTLYKLFKKIGLRSRNKREAQKLCHKGGRKKYV